MTMNENGCKCTNCLRALNNLSSWVLGFWRRHSFHLQVFLSSTSVLTFSMRLLSLDSDFNLVLHFGFQAKCFSRKY